MHKQHGMGGGECGGDSMVMWLLPYVITCGFLSFWNWTLIVFKKNI